MNEDQLYEMIVYVLKWRGQIRNVNSLRTICVFEDEKLVVDGFSPLYYQPLVRNNRLKVSILVSKNLQIV